MSSLFAMRRANGDWFALDDYGRLRMPVFHSSSAAMRARSRRPEMFLFKPMVFDDRALMRLTAEAGGDEVCFWLVDDPFVNLKRGHPLDRTQLGLLMHNAAQPPLP